MLNKKILATAVAVAFSSNAFAAIDLDGASAGTLTVANEALAGLTADANGRYTFDNTGNEVAATTAVGFTVGQGESRFVRVDVDGGVFGAAPTLATDSGSATFNQSVSSGGGVGDDFVIFEISDSGQDILNDDELT
jgi:hypothetical protein